MAPKIRHIKGDVREDPWAKLRGKPGVTVQSEAVFDA